MRPIFIVQDALHDSPVADAIYIFERTGKVKLIGIADHGADGADGQAAFGQQLCRPCHAVVQQEPLWLSPMVSRNTLLK